MSQYSRHFFGNTIRGVMFGLAMFIAQHVYAANESPQSFTLDGQLLQVGTQNPLLDSAAKITIDILNPAKTCILYEEQQTVNTSTTNGYYNIQVGSYTGDPKRTASDPGNGMAQVYQNLTAITGMSAPGQTCTGNSYTPAMGDVRYFRITVTPSATGIADTLSPDTVMSSVPIALVAQTLQGLDRSAFLQVNTSGGVNLSQTSLNSLFSGTAYTNLQNVESGNYLASSSTGAADLPSYTNISPPTSPVAGSIWYNTTANAIEYYNGTTTQSLASGTSLSPSGAAGAVQISGGSTLASDATYFFWDLTNHRLGIGTATPSYPLDTRGSIASGPVISGANSDTTSASYGVYGSATSSSTGTSGVYGVVSSSGNAYGVAGSATSTSGTPFGGYFTSASTGAGTGVYGAETGASNTGYAGYFNNSSATGWGIYSAGLSSNYFAGSVGIGIATPSAPLEVRGNSNIIVFKEASTGGYRGDISDSGGNGSMDIDDGAQVNNVHFASSGSSWLDGGNVGIGTSGPRATLDIQGGSLLTNPETVNTTTTIDFSKGNIQYTTSSCGAYTFYNMKDGGTYTFVVKGTTSATCSFTAYSDAGVTLLTVHLPPDNGATVSGKQTLFSLLVAGADLYVAWTPGY